MNTKLVIILMMVIVLVLAACGGDSATNTPPPPTDAPTAEPTEIDVEAPAEDESTDAEDVAGETEEPEQDSGSSQVVTADNTYTIELSAVDPMVMQVLAPRTPDPLVNRVESVEIVDGVIRIAGTRRIDGENRSVILEQTLTVEDGQLISVIVPSGDAGIEADDERIISLNDVMARSYIRLIPVREEIVVVSVEITDTAVVIGYNRA